MNFDEFIRANEPSWREFHRSHIVPLRKAEQCASSSTHPVFVSSLPRVLPSPWQPRAARSRRAAVASPDVHRLEDIEIVVFKARRARCSCGWRSGLWSLRRDATNEWRNHRASFAPLVDPTHPVVSGASPPGAPNPQ